MKRRPDDLTLTDLPHADAARFEAWQRLHRRARIAVPLGMVPMATAALTVPLIGGAIGWLLPELLFFSYIIVYAIPVTARERKLAAELGVPAALGITPAQLARTERRLRLAKIAGLSLMGLLAVWVATVFIVATRSDGRPRSSTGAAALVESYTVRLSHDSAVHPAARVQPGFFETAAVRPMAGRFFTTSEHAAPVPPVVVISYDVWQRVFSGDLALLGQSIELDGQPAMVIAIAPAGFSVPARTEFWTPAVERRP